MENKTNLTEKILQEHIINDNYYNSIFNIFHEEFDLNLINNKKYNEEVNYYKAALTSRLCEYLNKIYSYEELVKMSLDTNSPLYHRMITQEYKDIIHAETTIFSIDLRNKFAENGEIKKNFWYKIKNFFNKL